jgi:hypothetical protein
MSNLVAKKCENQTKKEEYEMSDESVPEVQHQLVNYMSIIVKESRTEKEQRKQEVENHRILSAKELKEIAEEDDKEKLYNG